jgi:hypothetical protein
MWCIPPQQNAAFACQMEEVLGVYKLPHDRKYPVVCLDEEPVQLLGEAREPLPTRPGEVAKQDHEYERNGTANVFCAFEPPGDWRTLEATERRTKLDFARFVKGLLDGRYKDADKVVLVMDNPNTHAKPSLYEAFEPAEAQRLADKLEIHHAPKHGGWLNMAEIELSVLGKRLAARVGRKGDLAAACAAVEQERNDRGATIDWCLTTEDARVKLKRLYTTIQVS